MRALVVTSFASDAIGGGPDRTRGIAEGLAANGYEVQILRLPVRKSWRSPRHLPWWYLLPSGAWLRELAQRAASADLVVGCYLPVASACAQALRGGTDRPFIYDADNDETALARQLHGKRVAGAVEQMERLVITKADVTWAAGHKDATSLASRYPRYRFVNAPNGVSVLPDLSARPRLPGQAFVYGSWGYRPNVDGLMRIASADTDAEGTIRIFGSIDGRTRRTLTRQAKRRQPGITWRFVGYEPDLELLAGSGAAAMIPLWSGAGTKLRAVQLTGLGVPVVATPEALSGLPEWLREAVPVQSDPARLLELALNGEMPAASALATLRCRVLRELHWSKVVYRALRESGLRATGPRGSE